MNKRMSEGLVSWTGGFGSPPIKNEGQAVAYDMEEQVMEIPVYETEVQIDGAEEINE